MRTSDWVRLDGEHDRNRASLLQECGDRGRVGIDDRVQGGLTSSSIGGIKANNDLDVAALNPPKRRKFVPKRRKARLCFRIVARRGACPFPVGR